MSQTPDWRILTLLLLLGFSGCRNGDDSATSAGDGAGLTGRSRVLAQGQILPKDGFIRLMASPGDTIESVHPDAKVFGPPVNEGDELVVLRSSERLAQEIEALEKQMLATRAQEEQELAQAKSRVVIAEQKLNSLRKREASLAKQQSLLDVAAQQVAASKSVLEKLERIASGALTREFVGELEIDRQRIAVSEAELQYEQQKDSLEQAALNLLDQIKAAELELELAQQVVDLAKQNQEQELNPASVYATQIKGLQLQLQAARIIAPRSATIVAMNATAGSAVLPQVPLVEMADLNQIVCHAEINERDASKVQVGNKATLTSRAFDEPIVGRVDAVHRMVGRPQLRSLDPLARTDYRSVTAVISICDASLARDWLQLQVQIEIDTDEQIECPPVPNSSD